MKEVPGSVLAAQRRLKTNSDVRRLNEIKIINGVLMNRNYHEKLKPFKFDEYKKITEEGTIIDVGLILVFIYKTSEHVYYLDVFEPDLGISMYDITPDFIINFKDTIKLPNFTGDTNYYSKEELKISKLDKYKRSDARN